MSRRLFMTGLLGMALVSVAACSRGPDDSEFCERAYERIEAKAYAEADTLLSQCLDSENVSADDKRVAYLRRAWTRYSLNRPGDAARDQEAAFGIEDRRSYGELINYTLYLREAGRLEDSLKTIRLAREYDRAQGQASMPVQYHLGWTLQEMGRHEEAIEAFSKGIPAQPDFASAYYKRGLSYEALGQRDKAMQDFEKVSELLQTDTRGYTGAEAVAEYRRKLAQYGLVKDSTDNIKGMKQ